jgi:anti-anti-sigma regulatory factor
MTANELIAQALAKLDGASREVALDLSSVSRIDPSAIGALEKLAGAADEKAVKVALRGVHVDVYKVLKLVKLTPRFSFPAR